MTYFVQSVNRIIPDPNPKRKPAHLTIIHKPQSYIQNPKPLDPKPTNRGC